MTVTGQFPRTRQLIARDAEKEEIRKRAIDVAKTGKSSVLYFRARGGLGKTRLLKEAKEIIDKELAGMQVSLPWMLVSDIVDMYDFENRKPIEIERKLVDSLRREAKRKGLTDDQIETAFSNYEQKYDYYNKIRGFSHQATRTAENNIHSAFIEICNDLSELHPIVLRFDTFESILNIKSPDYSFVVEKERKSYEIYDNRDYVYITGINFVLDWFDKILNQIQSTLIIVAGRPVKSLNEDEDPLILIARKRDPSFKSFDLPRLEESGKILEYLKEYDLNVSEDRIPYIREITKGLPLLLTLYARVQPEEDEQVKTPQNYTEFEDYLIVQTFNLLKNLPSDRQSNDPPNPRYVFIFCLFILSCARRGIRREELCGVFDQLGIERDDQVIDTLEDETLIRSVEHWHPTEHSPTDSEQQKQNTLLLLHDEILVLIDQSKKLDELEYRKPILDFLCEMSEKQVRNLDPEVPRLKFLSDHMYYELTRDVTVGYRTYTVYADWLLRQRYIQDALILADVFWNTLRYEVTRGEETHTPFYDKLAESLQVSIADIEREEAVRYVKRLRFSDEHAESVAWAEALYTKLVGEEVLPADQDWTKLTELPQANTYVFVDLCLTWATAMTRSGADPERVGQLLTTLIRWLESEEAQRPPQWNADLPLHRHLAYLRRAFFLGETYNIRGQLYRNQQFYPLAVSDLQHGVDAFDEYQHKIPLYHDHPPVVPTVYLNDDVTGDIAQVYNNLAYGALENGELDKAQRLSDDVIQRYIVKRAIASSYQQALFYNTNALIRMRCDDYRGAGKSLEEARIAAEQSGVDRAVGLVARAEALYQRARWNNGLSMKIDDLLAIDDVYFERAASKLQSEPGSLGEIYYDRARFARDLALFFRRKNEPKRADDYWNKANRYLDRAAEEFEKSAFLNMQQANLRETRACLFILRGDDRKGDNEEASRLLDQADELMRKGKDMPSYAHVVAGKIALQRGLIWLNQGRAQEALQKIAIALTRTYLFAPAHGDQAAVEKLTASWVRDQQIATDDFSTFVRAMYAGEVSVKASDLPYLPPPADAWLVAWERSLKFFESLQQSTEVKANENVA